MFSDTIYIDIVLFVEVDLESYLSISSNRKVNLELLLLL